MPTTLFIWATPYLPFRTLRFVTIECWVSRLSGYQGPIMPVLKPSLFLKRSLFGGSSRFDYDRETLYQMISEFVEKNKGINRRQLERLGFSLDWSRYHYSLEPQFLETVNDTFRQLYRDGLIYRGERLVNYCPRCGTAFSDLEINHEEREDSLYYLDYGSLQIATTRPETIFADVAVAVNPQDKRYQKLIGQEATLPLLNKKLPIVADELVDPEFGTGALKITPGHDAADFEIGQRHDLELIKIIDSQGKMINVPSEYLGLSVKEARQLVVAELSKQEKLVKTESLQHTVSVCYRCGTAIEPTLMPQWFIKIKPLAEKAIQAVREGKTKIVPQKRFEKMYFDWLENIHDWNISRQIVWGPQIPAWYCLDCNPEIKLNFIDSEGRRISGRYQELKDSYRLAEIEKGLQSLTAPPEASYRLDDHSCEKCGGRNILQETDTFDTWFLSGQWPLTTLGFPDGEDFKYFYPTSVLDTMWDILFFWVARMMMLGLYRTGEVPFRTIHLHCRVVDAKGQKMSKSKGNVIDPMVLIDKYGADALRAALVFGASPGSDISLGDDKVRSMRNFANKVWNAARFILTKRETPSSPPPVPNQLSQIDPRSWHQLGRLVNSDEPDDRWIIDELNKTVRIVTNQIEKYRFDLAFEEIYHFFWHTFCDRYLEMSKKRRAEAQPILLYVLVTSLKLLHPFMPFVTELVWQKFREDYPEIVSEKVLAVAPWPQISAKEKSGKLISQLTA